MPRTAPQRRHDAVVAIFRTTADAEEVGSSADPLVNIVIDAGTWARLLTDGGVAPTERLDGMPIDPFAGLADPDVLLHELVDSPGSLHDRRCEASTCSTVHPHDVLRAALAGHARRVVVDSDGGVVDPGRRQRLFTGAARDAARLLIRHCEHPGCELPAEWCDVDHAHEWADGIIMLPVGVRPPKFPGDDESRRRRRPSHRDRTDGPPRPGAGRCARRCLIDAWDQTV